MKRWYLILLGLPLYLAGLVLVGTILTCLLVADTGDKLRAIEELLTEPGYLFSAFIVAGFLAVTQVLFLLPVRVPLARERQGKPLIISIIVAGGVAGLLFLGLLMSMIELEAIVSESHMRDHGFRKLWFPLVSLGGLAGSWVLWSAAMISFARRKPAETVLSRMFGGLLAGTLIEVVVVIPIDIMVRRRTDCYCTTGTFVALMLSTLALMWLTGPGLFIAIASKRRRAWKELHCWSCGQQKGPTPGERCPECGALWSTGQESTA